MGSNSRNAAVILMLLIGVLGSNGNHVPEPSLAPQRHPPVNHSGLFHPEVSRIIQIATSSNDLRIDLYALSEEIKSRNNPDGFDPEVMLRTAFANSNSDVVTFGEDMNALLKKFVRHRMSIASIFTDRFYDGDFKKILTRYKFVEQSQGSSTPTALAADDFTLYRLVAAFPYETALLRTRSMDVTWLPGLVGKLNPVLAFPYAPLIIPDSWNETRAQWRKWYASFSSSMAGYPLPDELKRRQEKLYQSMTAIARERGNDLVEKMELLGVAEPTSSRPARV